MIAVDVEAAVQTELVIEGKGGDERRGPESARVQNRRERRHVGGNLQAVVARAVAGRIAAGQEAGTRRRTQRVLAEGSFEEGTAGGQPVNIGRLHPGVAVAAQRIESLLVGADP